MWRIMSRPSKTESAKLEALEGASGLLAQAMEATGILTIRLRQALRRAPRLDHILSPAEDELAIIVDNCDDARELLGRLLEIEQEQRRKDNRG